MIVNNDTNALSNNNGIIRNHPLNHSVVLEPQISSIRKHEDRMSSMTKWRPHALNVIIPRKISEHSDSDLRLMLVSLKNARSVSTVHIRRIERELMKRGCSLNILMQ